MEQKNYLERLYKLNLHNTSVEPLQYPQGHNKQFCPNFFSYEIWFEIAYHGFGSIVEVQFRST